MKPKQMANSTNKKKDQVPVVQKLLELLAVEPPIAVVCNVISSLNSENTCARRKNKEPFAFMARFRGIAADNLMDAGVPANFQVGEILETTLLKKLKY